MRHDFSHDSSLMKTRSISVCGDIGADKLGNTLTHEHLSMRFDVSFVPPKDNEAGLAKLDWSLKNYGWIHSNRKELSAST